MENYSVDLRFKLSDDQIDALSNLYQPVFSVPAVSLYLTLYGLGLRKRSMSRRELMRTLQIDAPTLEAYRKELERFALVRTYVKDQGFICVLQKPLRPLNFLQHASYGRLYSIVMGNDAFLEVKRDYLDLCIDVEGGHEISTSFDLNRLASWSVENEKGFNVVDTKPLRRHQFDGMQFFKSLSHVYFPISMRTSDVIELVEEIGSTYNLSYGDMKAKLLAATNKTSKHFDKSKFILLVEKEFGRQSAESVDNPYELDSVSFLAYKQNNDFVIEADKNLIKSLFYNFKFDNKVINVLLEYVLESNDKNLAKAYVEKVASTWLRKGVTTFEDALNQVKEPVKSRQTRTKRTSVVEQPVYQKTEVEVEDIDEYLNYAQEFLKGGK